VQGDLTPARNAALAQGSHITDRGYLRGNGLAQGPQHSATPRRPGCWGLREALGTACSSASAAGAPVTPTTARLLRWVAGESGRDTSTTQERGTRTLRSYSQALLWRARRGARHGEASVNRPAARRAGERGRVARTTCVAADRADDSQQPRWGQLRGLRSPGTRVRCFDLRGTHPRQRALATRSPVAGAGSGASGGRTREAKILRG